MSPKLWTEYYRPKSLDEYVWRDQNQKEKVQEWLADGVLPHLMLSGLSGTGKTSLAELLLKLLNIPNGDILKINASKERKVEDVQRIIINFVSTWALGESGVKYVLLDEADAMSPVAQKLLRGEMETYSDICRFIITCNYKDKIIPAIQGRCQGFHFEALEMDDFIARVGEILVRENVEFDIEDLVAHTEKTYPDLRKCINNVQQNVRANKLYPPSIDEDVEKDYLVEMVKLFKAGKTLEARKLITSQARAEEYPEIFRWFYQNLEIWGDDLETQEDALLVIKRGLVNHGLIADPEINLAACIVELTRLRKD